MFFYNSDYGKSIIILFALLLLPLGMFNFNELNFVFAESELNLDNVNSYKDYNGNWFVSGDLPGLTLNEFGILPVRISHNDSQIKIYVDNVWQCNLLHQKTCSAYPIFGKTILIFEGKIINENNIKGTYKHNPKPDLNFDIVDSNLIITKYSNSFTSDNEIKDKTIKLERANLELLYDKISNIESKLLKQTFIKISEERINLNDKIKQEYNLASQQSTLLAWHYLEERNEVITANYARLYDEHDFFKWAGLAAFASNYVGWAIYSSISSPDELKLLGQGNAAIFYDLAWQHEAYLFGGIELMQKFYQEGEIDKKTFDAWEAIDQGRRESIIKTSIWDGALLMAEVEQKKIIQEMYDQDREFWKTFTKENTICSPVPKKEKATFQKFALTQNLEPDLGSMDQRWNWTSKTILPDWKSIEISEHKFISELIKTVKKTGKLNLSDTAFYPAIFCTWNLELPTSKTIDDDNSLDDESQTLDIPDWIKNNAKWWVDGSIDDQAFVSGIQFLITNGVIHVPATENSSPVDFQNIPTWIKNNADWWSQGLISDDDFVKGIQFMVENGIVVV